MSQVLQSLFVLGSSHKEAPLELREHFALSPEMTLKLQNQLFQLKGIQECLVISTCNRVEVYGLGSEPNMEDQVRGHFCALKGIDRMLFDQHSFWHTNLDVLQHALELSAGLDSQMVGETEILGQMKSAYAAAREGQTTGIILNRLFEKSFQAAKSARTLTGVSRGQVSIGNIAVDLAARIFGHLSKSRVLLLGSGEVAEKTAQALKSRGVSDITVASRTFENAHQLAHSLGGSVLEFSDFQAQLYHFDIVISSTSAREIVLNKASIYRAIKQRAELPLFLIDLALPRDIDPGVEAIENVYLYNLDDLSKMANENLALRRAEIEQARTILKAHAWNLWLHLRRRTLMPSPKTMGASLPG